MPLDINVEWMREDDGRVSGYRNPVSNKIETFDTGGGSPPLICFPLLKRTGAILSSVSPDNPFPDLTINGTTAQLWNNAGLLTLTGGGNRTSRISNNAVIDELMRLDNLASGPFKCAFFALWLQRDTATADLTTAERIFQYGDQGSSTTDPYGGWVARLNGTSPGTAPFIDMTISFAVHTPWPGDLIGKTGGQTDPDYADLIYTTPVFTDAQFQAGLSILFAVDASEDPFKTHVFVDGVRLGGDSPVKSTKTYPLPGISKKVPQNGNDSGGLVLFNQSVDTAASGLKESKVSPIWIGRARDLSHLKRIAFRHHLDKYANPVG